jgi:hypothetical protein
MSFHASPPLLYLGGPVVQTDWAAWEEAMQKYDGQIQTIVFHESSGGDSNTGRRIGRDIRKRMLNTVVAGRCASACANMFLAGVSRQFATSADKDRIFLGYHGSYNKVTKALNTKRTPDYFVEMTAGKMTEEFVNRFIRLENRSGLMRFMHRDQINANTPLTMLCKGDEDRTKRNERCEKLTDVDAIAVGVLTTWETLEIAAPPKPTREKTTLTSWQQGASTNQATGLTEYQGN